MGLLSSLGFKRENDPGSGGRNPPPAAAPIAPRPVTPRAPAGAAAPLPVRPKPAPAIAAPVSAPKPVAPSIPVDVTPGDHDADPNASLGALNGVLGDLVQLGQLSVERASEIQAEAARSGRPEYELLLQRQLVPRGDVYASIHRQPPAVRRDIGLVINNINEFPEATMVLNDVGGVLGGTRRDVEVLAIGASEELGQAKARGGKPRCFLLSTAEAAKGPGFKSLVGRVLNEGFEIRAILELANQSIAEVMWAQWDERRGASSKKSGSVTTESDAHKLFDKIAQEAYLLNASDIHIIAKGGVGSILFRVDGDVIRQSYDLTAEDAFQLIGATYDTLTETNSVKSGFSRTDQQDGSVDRSYEHCRLRFRYSGNPVEPNGYRVAMRVIPIGTHSKPKPLRYLGYAPSQCLLLDRAFSRSSGLVLFAGTTGSGKSTTMSNRLSLLCKERPTKVVLTVEEPVEYIIDGAHQSSVKRMQGEDGRNAFQRSLSTLMRQDPDVLMVGEIRDFQTADVALQGVRSGHLLISTLHAAAAPTCYDRLAGLGVPRLDMATMDLVAAFCFQALTQTLCPHCKRPAHEFINSTDPEIAGTLHRLRYALDEERIPGASTTGNGLDGIFFRNEAGCQHCKDRGITGRTVCAEVFQPTPEMLPMVSAGNSVGIWEAWRAQINLKDPADMTGRRAIEHGMWKMANGIVCPREIESQFRLLDEPLFKV